MLKVDQLMIARWLDWLTVTLPVPDPWMVAEPPATLPPIGSALAGNDPNTRVIMPATIRDPATTIPLVPLSLAADNLQSAVRSQTGFHTLDHFAMLLVFCLRRRLGYQVTIIISSPNLAQIESVAVSSFRPACPI